MPSLRASALCVPLLAVATALAGVPEVTTFQGRLSDGNGPVTASVSMDVGFYDDAVAGNLLWSESHAAVVVTDGIFTLEIGSETVNGMPAEAMQSSEIWIGISVHGGAELTPRTRLATTPFADRARHAEALVNPATFLPLAYIHEETGDLAVVDVGEPAGVQVASLFGPQAYIDLSLVGIGALVGARLEYDNDTGLISLGGLTTPDRIFDPILNIDRASALVGIGTTTPINPLSVAGDADITGITTLGTAIPNPNARLTIEGVGAGHNLIQFQRVGGLNEWHLAYTNGGLNFVESGVSTNRLLLEDGGNVGIGTLTPTARLHVGGDARFDQIVMYDDVGTQTLEIDHQDPESNLLGSCISMFNGTGDRTVQLDSDQGSGNAFLTLFSTGPAESYVSADEIGAGITYPDTALHAVDSLLATVEPTNSIALIENVSTSSGGQHLAIQTHASDLSPGTAMNFITFYNQVGDSLGALQGDNAGGVQLGGPGSDYAEWLAHLGPGEEFEPGDVVGVFGGRITKRTADACQVMVISTAPIVAGNRPAEENEQGVIPGWEQIAFVGQVPVRVEGPVKVGDLVVASGRHDGIAIAVDPAAIRAGQIRQVVGTAWEQVDTPGVHLVNTAVGIDQAAVAIAALEQVESRLDRLADRLDALEQEASLAVAGGNR